MSVGKIQMLDGLVSTHCKFKRILIKKVEFISFSCSETFSIYRNLRSVIILGEKILVQKHLS